MWVDSLFSLSKDGLCLGDPSESVRLLQVHRNIRRVLAGHVSTSRGRVGRVGFGLQEHKQRAEDEVHGLIESINQQASAECQVRKRHARFCWGNSSGILRVNRSEGSGCERGQQSMPRRSKGSMSFRCASALIVGFETSVVILLRKNMFALPCHCGLRFRGGCFEVFCLAGTCKRLRACHSCWLARNATARRLH